MHAFDYHFIRLIMLKWFSFFFTSCTQNQKDVSMQAEQHEKGRWSSWKDIFHTIEMHISFMYVKLCFNVIFHYLITFSISITSTSTKVVLSSYYLANIFSSFLYSLVDNALMLIPGLECYIILLSNCRHASFIQSFSSWWGHAKRTCHLRVFLP